MSVNSSSSTNTSYLFDFSLVCFFDRPSTITFTAFCISDIVIILPVCIVVIYLGLQKWQKQRSASRAETTSHSDIFTYHMIVIEMICMFGGAVYCGGVLSNIFLVKIVGTVFINSISNGQIFIHTLTCAERYLAVVHPVTYMGLKNRNGVRIRNISLVFIWLLLPATVGLQLLPTSLNLIIALSILVFAAAAVSFCSFSVLCILIRPGPGDGSKDREPADKTKIRAFHTIVAITATLMLRLTGHVLVIAIYFSPLVSMGIRCTVLMSGIWFSLPSSLVLPLLFLHRAGKLLCCKSNAGPE